MEKKKTKPFQLGMIIGAVVLIVVAVVVFSKSDRSKKESSDGTINYGAVTVWGTIPPTSDVTKVFSEFNRNNDKTVTAAYTYVASSELEQTLLEALSNDKGPDVIILPNEWFHKNTLRIAPIPYDPAKGGVGVRDFKDTFTQAGEIYLYPEGIMALPLAIDPLVLYWNRDLFSNAEVVAPPTSWKEVLSLTSKLTKKKNLDVTQSTIALGEYENVARAKDILSLMFLQVGSPITAVGVGGLSGVLNQSTAVIQAIRFYVDFANPLKSGYTWNRSLPNSQDAFLSNDLAMYLDFASANKTLLAKNPRLNFDLAPVPQTDGQPTAVTYGRVHGLSVMKKAKNLRGGMVFGKLFAGKVYASAFAQAAGMAPVRKDLLAVPQADAFQATLYGASLRARSWIDPQPLRTDEIFSRMIDTVISGKADADSAVNQANTEMNSIISGVK